MLNEEITSASFILPSAFGKLGWKLLFIRRAWNHYNRAAQSSQSLSGQPAEKPDAAKPNRQAKRRISASDRAAEKKSPPSVRSTRCSLQTFLQNFFQPAVSFGCSDLRRGCAGAWADVLHRLYLARTFGRRAGDWRGVVQRRLVDSSPGQFVT